MADQTFSHDPEDSHQDNKAAAETSTSVQPIEPEDAYLTGSKRSLQRRVLGLNVDGDHGQGERHPDTPAGQHATGSFTGDTSKDAKDSKNP